MADKGFESNWDEPEWPKPSRRSFIVFLIVLIVVCALMGGLVGFGISQSR